MFCSNCGAELQTGNANFCSGCGAEVPAIRAAPTNPLEPRTVDTGQIQKVDLWGRTWKDVAVRFVIFGGIITAFGTYTFKVNNPDKSLLYGTLVTAGGGLLLTAIIGTGALIIRKLMPSTRAEPAARSFGIAIGLIWLCNLIAAGCVFVLS